jgi:transposase
MVLVAAIDIHKLVFQAAVLDPESGEVVESRFSAERASLVGWAEEWRARVSAVAIEATTGWRWVWRELSNRGFDVRLAEPVQARALLGRRRTAKTDRLDARWLARLLAKEMLPESWIPPEEIQQLRDRTRLRSALAEDRRRWALRLHAFLAHVGWPCARSRLLTVEGQRWVAGLCLPGHAQVQVDTFLAVIAALEVQLEAVDAELRRFARADERCQALQTIYGVGPILASICSRRSARRAASAAPARSQGWPAWIRSSRNPARRAGAASSPRPAPRTFAGHWSRPQCTHIARPPRTSRSTSGSASAATPPSPG